MQRQRLSRLCSVITLQSMLPPSEAMIKQSINFPCFSSGMIFSSISTITLIPDTTEGQYISGQLRYYNYAFPTSITPFFSYHDEVPLKINLSFQRDILLSLAIFNTIHDRFYLRCYKWIINESHARIYEWTRDNYRNKQPPSVSLEINLSLTLWYF